MQNHAISKPAAKDVTGDFALLESAFIAYLRERHTAARTISTYRGVLRRLARSFNRHGRSLSTLRREEIPALIRRRWRGRATGTRRVPQAALHAWLKLLGRFHLPAPRTPWRGWTDDYARFMEADRGLAPSTRYHYLLAAERYLAWQFRRAAVAWHRIRTEDIWRYAVKLNNQGWKPKSVSDELSGLRQFLRFVHLRGG